MRLRRGRLPLARMHGRCKTVRRLRGDADPSCRKFRDFILIGSKCRPGTRETCATLRADRVRGKDGGFRRRCHKSAEWPCPVRRRLWVEPTDRSPFGRRNQSCRLRAGCAVFSKETATRRTAGFGNFSTPHARPARAARRLANRIPRQPIREFESPAGSRSGVPGAESEFYGASCESPQPDSRGTIRARSCGLAVARSLSGRKKMPDRLVPATLRRKEKGARRLGFFRDEGRNKR